MGSQEDIGVTAKVGILKPKKKAFIDRKKAVSFRLLHRSQRDPRIADDDAQHVLAPISSKHGSREERKAEERKYGVDFDDDYDYLQHLRDTNELYSLEEEGPSRRVVSRFRITKEGDFLDLDSDIPEPPTSAVVTGQMSKLRIPGSVLATENVELATGLLNQAAPSFNPDLDPDVMAALEDNRWENEDGQLEDDFVRLANAPSEGEEALHETRDHSNDEEDEEMEKDSGSEGPLSGSEDGEEDWAGEETRTRFTNYSVTSSVMRRSDGLQLLDQRFEKLYEQYDPEQLGDLEEAAVEGDEPDLTGTLNPDSDRILDLAAQYAKDKEREKRIGELALATQDEVAVEKAREAAASSSEESDVEVALEPPASKRAWDCESVCSTYSNLYNRPSLIREPPRKRHKAPQKIFINPKTGLPFPEAGEKRTILSAALAKLDAPMETASVSSVASTARPKGETAEQRRARKAAVKAQRRERRAEKKGNKLAFVEEKQRLVKSAINASATAGLKL